MWILIFTVIVFQLIGSLENNEMYKHVTGMKKNNGMKTWLKKIYTHENWFLNHCFKNLLQLSLWHGLKLQWHRLTKTSRVDVQCFYPYLLQNWLPLVSLSFCFLFELLSITASFAINDPSFFQVLFHWYLP